MTITLLQLLYSLVLIQATTYGLFSVMRRFPNGLSLFLLGVSAHMLLNLIYEWQLLGIHTDYSFGWASLYGPAFYFYIRSLSLRPIRRAVGLVHFAPFILVNLLNLLALSGDWLGPIVGLQLIVYLVLSAAFVYKAYRSLPTQHSEPVKALMLHTRSMLGLFACLLIYDTWARSQSTQPVLLGLSFSEITLFGVLVLINLMFLRQISIPAAEPLSEKPAEQDSELAQQNSGEDEQMAAHLKQRTQREGLFKIPNLTLAKLAAHFDLSEKRCSDLLNKQLKLSFSDFINQLRVEACQIALRDHADKNVLDIGFEFGFNSKTAFNTAFKKFAGTTPTQYRKSVRSDIGT